jgi:hypothetical protein
MALLQRIAAARNKAVDEAAAAAATAGGGRQQQHQQHGQPQRLKVILMSATLDANIYRCGGAAVACLGLEVGCVTDIQVPFKQCMAAGCLVQT